MSGARHAADAKPRRTKVAFPAMKLAYLVNQYPKTSHTFIRREIAAVEALGLEVERFTIRPTEELLEDRVDEAEKVRTKVVLDRGAIGLLESLLQVGLSHPAGFARALGLALDVGRRSDRGLLRHVAYLAEACALRRWVERTGCEHVHAHFGTNSATVAMLCRELGGPPFSFTVHGPEEFDKPDLIALAKKIEKSAFVAAVSSFALSQLYRRSNMRDWGKLHVVRCGVDDDYLAAPRVPIPMAPRLVCVGRLCEQKGQLILIEAAAELVRSGLAFELVLVGDGELRAELERAVNDKGLARTVRFVGWASNERVREEILAARALVLPSFAEGLPVVLMEAFALRRPVISTYVAGIPELVVPGSGWLVPAGSLSPLVAAMRQALTAPPSMLEKMGAAGEKRVRELHEVRASAKTLSSLVREVAA
jgi:colanic acid/amylovoran biosynthesis glycosyltransferase